MVILFSFSTFSGYNGELNSLTPNSDFYGVSQQNISRVLDETGLGFGLTVSGSRTESDLAPWDELLEQSFSNSGYVALTPEESFTAGLNLQESESVSMSQVYSHKIKVKMCMVFSYLYSMLFSVLFFAFCISQFQVIG
jgi:hypothetical protein